MTISRFIISRNRANCCWRISGILTRPSSSKLWTSIILAVDVLFRCVCTQPVSLDVASCNLVNIILSRRLYSDGDFDSLHLQRCCNLREGEEGFETKGKHRMINIWCLCLLWLSSFLFATKCSQLVFYLLCHGQLEGRTVSERVTTKNKWAYKETRARTHARARAHRHTHTHSLYKTNKQTNQKMPSSELHKSTPGGCAQ